MSHQIFLLAQLGLLITQTCRVRAGATAGQTLATLGDNKVLNLNDHCKNFTWGNQKRVSEVHRMRALCQEGGMHRSPLLGKQGLGAGEQHP